MDNGGEVIYICGNVSNKQDVSLIIKETKQRFGKINGVFHMAGVIRDNYLMKKTESEIQEVIEPKILGSIYLDELTKEEPLDFFVLFSSISGLLGNIGQCDYAFANNFMDHFVEIREQRRRTNQCNGKTLSINWPLWEEGGMNVDSEIKQAIKNSTGMDALASKDAFTILERGLRSKLNQFTIFTGDLEKSSRYSTFKIKAYWFLMKKYNSRGK